MQKSAQLKNQRLAIQFRSSEISYRTLSACKQACAWQAVIEAPVVAIVPTKIKTQLGVHLERQACILATCKRLVRCASTIVTRHRQCAAGSTENAEKQNSSQTDHEPEAAARSCPAIKSMHEVHSTKLAAVSSPSTQYHTKCSLCGEPGTYICPADAMQAYYNQLCL
jgi:hypothetical protein